MPILTVVSDTLPRFEDGANELDLDGSNSVVATASMYSDDFDDDPPGEFQPDLPSVPADELARWFG
jgi:hypothetical protein